MNKYEYEKFEDWFEEMEITADRSDRFYDELKYMTYQRGVEWLRAAWDCARAQEEKPSVWTCSYCNDPTLSEIIFDQTCPGCVERMSEHTKELK